MIEELLEASNRFEYALGSDASIQDTVNKAIDDVLEFPEASPLVGLLPLRRKVSDDSITTLFLKFGARQFCSWPSRTNEENRFTGRFAAIHNANTIEPHCSRLHPDHQGEQ